MENFKLNAEKLLPVETANLEEKAWELLDCSGFPKELRKEWENSILTAGSEDELKSLLEKLNKAVEERKKIDQTRFSAFPQREQSFVEEDRAGEVLEIIREIMAKKKNFLGFGQTAEVFTSETNPSLCYKIITNPVAYRRGNDVAGESDFLSRLTSLKIEGARVPMPYYCLMNSEIHFLLMERIDGIPIDDAIEKGAVLPQKFNLKKFFRELERFVKKMNELGIYHNDLHTGNIMVDRDGLPCVIDFGKAESRLGSFADLTKNEKRSEVYCDDLKKIEEAEKELARFLKSKGLLTKKLK